MLNSLEVMRAIRRAFGITDPVELEVAVLTPEPFSWTLKPRADALRDDAREALPATATPAEVDAEAIRILHELAGLVPPRWAPTPAADRPHDAEADAPGGDPGEPRRGPPGGSVGDAR